MILPILGGVSCTPHTFTPAAFPSTNRGALRIADALVVVCTRTDEEHCRGGEKMGGAGSAVWMTKGWSGDTLLGGLWTALVVWLRRWCCTDGLGVRERDSPGTGWPFSTPAARLVISGWQAETVGAFLDRGRVTS